MPAGSGCKELIDVLKSLEKGVIKKYDNSYQKKFLGYCFECGGLSLIAGDVSEFVGDDGDDCSDEGHYENVETPKKCMDCYTSHYIDVSSRNKDVLKLEPTHLVAGIDSMLKCIPAYESKHWAKLSLDSKFRQVGAWYSMIKKREKAREEYVSLEKALG
ncbi:MAG: hypothetical protein V1839_03815 [archaeon]